MTQSNSSSDGKMKIDTVVGSLLEHTTQHAIIDEYSCNTKQLKGWIKC